MENRSFTKLYNNYQAAIFCVICSYIKDRFRAQDVLQNTFIKIAQHLERYDSGKGVLFTWMRTIAVHTALDELKSNAYKHAQQVISLDDPGIAAECFAYDDPLGDKVGLENLFRVLSENERNIIKLLYFKEYSHSEASAYFAIPLGTLKSRVRIALYKMRKYGALFS